MLDTNKINYLLEFVRAIIAVLEERVTFYFVVQALKSNSVFSLKIHKESEFNFTYILEQWTKKCSSGARVVLGEYILFV